MKTHRERQERKRSSTEKCHRTWPTTSSTAEAEAWYIRGDLDPRPRLALVLCRRRERPVDTFTHTNDGVGVGVVVVVVVDASASTSAVVVRLRLTRTKGPPGVAVCPRAPAYRSPAGGGGGGGGGGSGGARFASSQKVASCDRDATLFSIGEVPGESCGEEDGERHDGGAGEVNRGLCAQLTREGEKVAVGS